MKVVENKIRKGTFEGRIAFVRLVEYWDDDRTFQEMLDAGPIDWLEDTLASRGK
jgi:hypothetical protein